MDSILRGTRVNSVVSVLLFLSKMYQHIATVRLATVSCGFGMSGVAYATLLHAITPSANFASTFIKVAKCGVSLLAISFNNATSSSSSSEKRKKEISLISSHCSTIFLNGGLPSISALARLASWSECYCNNFKISDDIKVRFSTHAVSVSDRRLSCSLGL